MNHRRHFGKARWIGVVAVLCLALLPCGVLADGGTEAAREKGGHVTADITEQNVKDIMKRTQESVEKSSQDQSMTSIAAVIEVDTGDKNPDTVFINLPQTVQEQIIGSSISNVTFVIRSLGISMNLDQEAIKELSRQAKGEIQFTVARMNGAKLSSQARDIIGSRPIFELKATCHDGKSQLIYFGTGSVTVEIPYTLRLGENGGNVCAVRVDNNGRAVCLSGSGFRDDAVQFSVQSFSVYGIGFKSPQNFNQLKDDWVMGLMAPMAALHRLAEYITP